MARKTNAAVALALSALLAFGTLPAPALAEMATEAGAATTAQGSSVDLSTVDGEQRVAEDQKEPSAVSDGLGRATLALSSAELSWSGLPAKVTAKVTSAKGVELARGTDYELAYYAADGKELAESPSAPGSYLVSARGVAGGAWVGETEPAAFKISAPEAAELAAGRTEATLAERSGWVGRVSAPGTYHATVSSDARVDLVAYADAGLSEKIAAADASGRLELAVAQGSSVWVTLSQPEGAAATASVELAAATDAKESLAPEASAPESSTTTPADPDPTTEAPAPTDPAPAKETSAPGPAPSEPTFSTESDQHADAAKDDKTALSTQSGSYFPKFGETCAYRDDTYVQVFFSQDGSYRPKTVVNYVIDNRLSTLVEGTDYDVSYELVDQSTGKYKCNITGKNAHDGYSETMYFRVVSSIDLDSYVRNLLKGTNVSVQVGPSTLSLRSQVQGGSYVGEEASTLCPSDPFIPYVRFRNTGMPCMQGTGFDVTVRDEQSVIHSTIDAPGTYTITLTARPGSGFSGSATLPKLHLLETLSIEDVGEAAWMSPAIFINESTEGEQKTYYISDIGNGLDPLNLFRVRYNYDYTSRIQTYLSGKALVEGVDYEVTRDIKDGYVDLLLKGKGRFSGTKTLTLYGISREQKFENLLGMGMRGGSRIVYLDSEPTGRFASESSEFYFYNSSSFAPGREYVVEGYRDAQGQPITTATVGDEVYVTARGLGLYEGCSATVKAVVRPKPYGGVDLASDAVGVSVLNGVFRWEYHTDGTQSGNISILKGLEPSVAVSVYARGVLLREGDGFTVTKALSSDGNYMDVTTTASGDSMVTGTKTTRLRLVDKYQMNENATYIVRGPLDYAYTLKGATSGSLSYDGTPFVPTVEQSSIYGEGSTYWGNIADFRLSRIVGPDGATHQAVDGPGDYTLELTGTGDWTGSVSLPINVLPVSGDTYLENCIVSVAEACEIADGQARPEVTVRKNRMEQAYVRDTDYEVEYGPNNEVGKLGWVKVTAKEGNQKGLKGSNVASFLVTGGDTKLAFDATDEWTTVELEEPNGDGFYQSWPVDVYSYNVHRIYKIPVGGKATPRVRVVTKRDNGTMIVLPASDYAVTYEDNDKPGLATVRVEGRGPYAWTMPVHFYVATEDSNITPATTVRGGTDWSAVYDPEHYAAKNPDVAKWAKRADGSIDGNKLLQHFVDNGRREGRASKECFELASYYNANPDLRRAFGNDWARYYDHYRGNGQNEHRAATGVGQLRGYVTSRDGVNWAPVYDANYYAERNADVAKWARRSFSSGSVLDDAALLQHFVGSGTKECRSGKAGFDVRSYYNANPDLRAAFGGSADWTRYYRHYATNGSRENRKCAGADQLQGTVTKLSGTDWSPVYDRAYYGQRNADVVTWATRKCGSATVLDDYAMLSHFVGNGRREGRASKAGFELASYYNANADLRRAFGTDWARYYDHYRGNGQREGRAAAGVGQLRGAATSAEGVNWAPVYDASYYAQRNADVANWATRRFSSGSVLDDAALLSHFVGNGTKEACASKQSFEVHAYRSKNADLARAFGNDWKSYYRHYAKFGVNEHRPCV